MARLASEVATEPEAIAKLLADDMGHSTPATTLGGAYVTRAAVAEAERQRRLETMGNEATERGECSQGTGDGDA